GLSLAVGVALADALDPPSTIGPQRIGLKWPNDLWLLDAANDATRAAPGRKLGGILIETVPAGSERLTVVGIGLNVLPLKQEVNTGHASLQEIDADIGAPVALARLAKPLVEALQRFNAQGFAGFAERFAARDLLRGRQVSTTLPQAPEGVASGVSAKGALLLQTDTALHEVSSGDVSVRLQSTSSKDAPC
ncbi:MAG TPA: biotin--[acetyl-CoA-carboxylase] ligase, partial [Rhizobacter sp.]|nr:biotin--[acetyl-CoA-carboxylase] ligase [Rhizobacter sp.]